MDILNSKWTPMLLKEVSSPFNSNDYIYEIKFDGIRACIFIKDNKIEIRSRNNKDLTSKFPELLKIRELTNKNTVLDGEIIVMENGVPSFEKVVKRVRIKDKNKIEYEALNNPVVFICFDILYYKKDLTSLTLNIRKKYLNKIKENDVLIKSKIYFDGIKLFNRVKQLDLEGIVAKDKNSKYYVNTRSNSWLKIKNKKDKIVFICGYQKKKKNISVLLGDLKDNKLYYVGNANITSNNLLYNKILSLKKISKTPFINYDKNDVVYIDKKIKCEVSYLEITKNNYLRHAVIRKEVK